MYIVESETGSRIEHLNHPEETGFEKLADGNYFKKAGDIRCITEKSIVKSIALEENIIQENPLAIIKSDIRTFKTNGLNITEEEIKAVTQYKMSHLQRDVCILEEVIFVQQIRLPNILVGDEYRKIVLDYFLNEIKFWIKVKHGKPDFVIEDALTKDGI